jgi:hypothetical protein
MGECDADLGNARLGLIEAVTALEVEVKKLMSLRLRLYGVSKSAVDRIVRETPLADLATAWIRRELQGLDSPADIIFQRCAEAIHERNELIHHERRAIAVSRARAHVEAIADVTRLARRAQLAPT